MEAVLLPDSWLWSARGGLELARVPVPDLQRLERNAEHVLPVFHGEE